LIDVLPDRLTWRAGWPPLVEQHRDDGELSFGVRAPGGRTMACDLPWIFSSLGRWKWNCTNA
jgi:hypothetical protein